MAKVCGTCKGARQVESERPCHACSGCGHVGTMKVTRRCTDCCVICGHPELEKFRRLGSGKCKRCKDCGYWWPVERGKRG